MIYCLSYLVKMLNCWGLVRDEYLEVPAEALREAVLNALCHRQYERYNLTIGIAIYDDRIEIENPGVLPPHIGHILRLKWTTSFSIVYNSSFHIYSI